MVNNDLMLVVKGAEKPVLAHLFINYMLDPENAKANFAWNGYQPPIAGLEPEALIAEELVPESLDGCPAERVRHRFRPALPVPRARRRGAVQHGLVVLQRRHLT